MFARLICYFRGHDPIETKWSRIIESATLQYVCQCSRCHKIIELD